MSSQLSEQLKTHYASWMASLNIKQSLSISSSIRCPVTRAVRDKSRALNAPLIPSQALAVNTVSRGFNTPSFRGTCDVISPASHQTLRPTGPSLLSSNPAPPSNLTTFEPSSSGSTLPLPTTPPTDPRGVREVAEMLARKRVAEELINSQPQKKVRKRRTCRKCGRPECPGSQRVQNCRNPCQDCGKIQCEGRNPKLKNDTPCDRAWEGGSRN